MFTMDGLHKNVLRSDRLYQSSQRNMHKQHRCKIVGSVRSVKETAQEVVSGYRSEMQSEYIDINRTTLRNAATKYLFRNA